MKFGTLIRDELLFWWEVSVRMYANKPCYEISHSWEESYNFSQWPNINVKTNKQIWMREISALPWVPLCIPLIISI